MKNILLVIVAVILALGVQNFVLNKQAPGAVQNETTYDRVLRTGTLRCAYTPYSVMFTKDPNTGQLGGIYYDVITRLADNLKLKIDWVEEVGWGQQIEGLDAKRYDMVCSPVSLNSGRARVADFSIPLFYSPVHLWARKDSPLSGDLNALNNPQIKVSTLDGEQSSVFAHQFMPQAQQVSLPQSAPFSDLVMQVTTGKADIVISDPTAIEAFLKNNPDSLKQLTPDDRPLLVVPDIFLLARGQYEFKEMIDNGLRELFNEREIDRILDTYETVPGSYVRETARR